MLGLNQIVSVLLSKRFLMKATDFVRESELFGLGLSPMYACSLYTKVAVVLTAQSHITLDLLSLSTPIVDTLVTVAGSVFP